jgi:hypothetical protein
MSVDATFEFTGTATNPAPGGGFFYSDVKVLADGRVLPPGDNFNTQWDAQAPAGKIPDETFSFRVPRATHSLVVRVIPSSDPSFTADFRLW